MPVPGIAKPRQVLGPAPQVLNPFVLKPLSQASLRIPAGRAQALHPLYLVAFRHCSNALGISGFVARIKTTLRSTTLCCKLRHNSTEQGPIRVLRRCQKRSGPGAEFATARRGLLLQFAFVEALFLLLSRNPRGGPVQPVRPSD